MSFAKVIYMPEINIQSVTVLCKQSQMSEEAFENLRRIVQICARSVLDSSGRVFIEDQDPVALRRFYELIKKHEFVSKRYPYCWPALGYLDLWLRGRRSSYYSRRVNATKERLPPAGVRCTTPIWIRFAKSVESDQSLKEISNAECANLPRARPGRKRKHRQPKKDPKTEAGAVVDDIPDSSMNDTLNANGASVFMASVMSLLNIVSGTLLME